MSEAAAGDQSELDELRARLAEAEATLQAIRGGEVDALLIADDSGDRVYTLRGADAPYRALVEQMQDGAVTVSASGDIIYANRSFARLVGAPLQQVIGAPIERFIDSADRRALKALVADGAGKLRTRVSRRGQAPVDAHVSVSDVTVDGVTNRALIVADLSQLTKAQRESRSKDEFLAMLAHELRNPLGAIAGAVQVLRLATMRNAQARHARDVISRQVRHMTRLVDDLLDVGRVVTGKIVLDRHAVDLGDSVRTYLEASAAGQAVPGRVEVVAESVWVEADSVRLEQIIGNLVSNALKFTPPDERILVSVEPEGADAVLRVADRGAGIDPDLLPHIFDLFVQADRAIDRSTGGLGIGLTLARQLVELHGGTIEADSGGRDRGATFTVRLPAVPAVAQAPIGGRVKAPRRGRRVLLVDDNADAREMYGIMLRADGHDVREAGNGPEALAIFRRDRPDVAIVDIGLPGMDGFEVARLVRSEPEGRAVTLIALTGYGFPDDRERSRAAGFDRHFVKPVTPEELRGAIVEPGADGAEESDGGAGV